MKEQQFKIYRGSLDSTTSSTLSSRGSERIDFAPNRTEAPGDLADTQKPCLTVESKLKLLRVDT